MQTLQEFPEHPTRKRENKFLHESPCVPPSSIVMCLKSLHESFFIFFFILCCLSKYVISEKSFPGGLCYMSIRTDANSHGGHTGPLTLPLDHNRCLIKSHHSYFPHDVAVGHSGSGPVLCKCLKIRRMFSLRPRCIQCIS